MPSHSKSDYLSAADVSTAPAVEAPAQFPSQPAAPGRFISPVIDFAEVKRRLIAEGHTESVADAIIGDEGLRAAYRESMDAMLRLIFGR